MNYTIGEAAQIIGVTASTLRYYEKEGLLPYAERTSGGRRTYTDKDLATLTLIECLKKTGMQIKDIKHFIDMTAQGDKTIDGRLELFEMQRKKVMVQIAELEETLKIVEYKCWYYSTAKEHGSTEYSANIPDEELTERLREARNKLTRFSK